MFVVTIRGFHDDCASPDRTSDEINVSRQGRLHGLSGPSRVRTRITRASSTALGSTTRWFKLRGCVIHNGSTQEPCERVSNGSKGKARARTRRTRDSGSSHASPKGAGAPLATLGQIWTSAPELSSSRSAPPGKIHQGQSVWDKGKGWFRVEVTCRMA